MTLIHTWSVAAALAAVIALLAHRGGLLSGSGALAAWFVGTVAAGTGWSWATILVAYFVSASAFTRLGGDAKEGRMGQRLEKHGPRDALQVLANGGVFAAMALGHSMQPNSSWLTLAAGALAASAADTWATEIGALSPQTPRSILNGKRVPVGTSGGVTFAGLTAALAASLFLAAVIALVRWPAPAAVAALAGGFGGCQVDSLLGASAQARYWCASCAATTERRTHHCGNTTAQVGGWRALNNDGVNVLATVSGALMGWSVARLV